MWENILHFLAFNQYIPHGQCYLWQSSLMWLHILSDSLIGLAYYSIPCLIIYFARYRKDVPFRGIFFLFSAFIICCGTGHLIDVWSLWYPFYWLSGFVKLTTALISIYTVIELIPVIPKALNLVAPSELATLNSRLQEQVEQCCSIEQEVRRLNGELEKRVLDRTLELEEANRHLKCEISERQEMEAALRDSKLFAEKIAEVTPNILYIYDLSEEVYSYCNQYITEILGYYPRELLKDNQSLFDNLLHQMDRDKVMEYLDRCQHMQEDGFSEIEYRVKDSSGRWHWLLSKNTVFEKNSEGEVTQILGIASDITKRKETELQLQQVNQQLEERVVELETRNREMVKLGEMSDFLQACLSVQEAETVIADLIQPLFPESSGMIYRMRSSKNVLEMVTGWGDFGVGKESFMPNECWGLRRGVMHLGSKYTSSLCCQHIHHIKEIDTTFCIPMVAQGETLGLLYLAFPKAEQLTDTVGWLASTISKQLALAFANLQLQETLKHQSLRDPLTGLFNRRYLEESLPREIQIAAKQQKVVGVIMIDIDHFKLYNDTHGHDAGDLVLKEVGMFIQKTTPEIAITCRYGGEEFTVILPASSVEEVVEKAEKIRQDLKKIKVKIEGKALGNISASLGIACFPHQGSSGEELLSTADRALYQAKKQGRDRVVY